MSNAAPVNIDSVRVLFEKGTYFGNDSLFAHSGNEAPGVEGVLRPVLLQDDLIVTLVLVLSFVVLCYALSRGRTLIANQLKNLFSERKRNNMFTDSGSGFRYQVSLVAHAGVMLGVLVFDLKVREVFPGYRVPEWLVLGLCILGSMGLYGLKFTLYEWVNWVFFDKEKRDRWREVLSLLISLQGVVLFPLVCLSVYAGLSPHIVLLMAIITLFLVKILLFFKGKSIFFGGLRGLCYNILYLCTLEMIPVFILWKIIIEIERITHI
ncbi:MAG: DUF4271 domain-containing protein [Bacteroidaceae bacterium]|nr:DUF4271 domain-containing protein [Bacteroidaceae bacterium]